MPDGQNKRPDGPARRVKLKARRADHKFKIKGLIVGIIFNLDVINNVLFVLGYLHACGRDLESQRGMRRINLKRLVLQSFFRS